jgi:hypothetical protein
MTGSLPPRRYWRARTADDTLRSRREAILPGLVGAVALFAVLLFVSWVLGEVHAWLWYGASAVWVVVGGFWLELRAARRRQAEDERH